MRKELFFGILLSFICIASSSRADDWPGWRGPNRNGISEESDWDPLALVDEDVVLWRTEIGMGHSSVVVVGDRCYAMGNVPIQGVLHDVVFCLDVNTGTEIWRYTYPCPDIQYPGPRATPIIEEGAIYTLSWQGHVHCLDAECGVLLWKKNLVSEGLAEVPGFGFSGSPVIEGDLLLLNAGSLGLALDKKTGEVVWKSEPKAGTLPTPVLFTFSGKRLAGFPYGRALYAVDVETGEKAWWYPWYKDLDIDPVFIGNKMVLPGYKGTKVVALDGQEHSVLMENRKTRFNAYQNFVVIEGNVYGFAKDGDRTPLQCVDLQDGTVVWREDLGLYGSISAANGKLIIITGDGELIIADASPEAYKPISSLHVLHRPENASSKTGREWICWTQPVLSGGRIFVRCNYGQLACVDVRGDG